MKDAIKASWRCVLPPDKNGFMGFAVDGEDGRVHRFMLPVEESRSIAEATLDYLDANQEDHKVGRSLQGQHH